jgi:hypothetical protein
MQTSDSQAPEKSAAKVDLPPWAIGLIVGGGLILVGLLLIRFLPGFETAIADVKLGASLKDGRIAQAATVFSATTPEINCVVEVTRPDEKTSVRAVWIAPDARKIESTLPLSSTKNVAVFTLKGPPGGRFMTGNYTIEVYLQDKLDRVVPFQVIN